MVGTISDNVANDDQIRLSVQSLTDAKGDIFIDYDPNGSEIRDLGDNQFVAPPSAISFDRDDVAPSLAIATTLNDTQIAIQFDDAVQISTNEPTDFEVIDARGTPYCRRDFVRRNA